MTEVRARAARHKGQLNFESDLRALLFAYGDDHEPLPETIRVLDEIVADFIIETCHQAARSASYSNRQKIKVDDFKFAIRDNPMMLGRVQELLGMDKELKAAKQLFDDGEGKIGLEKSKPKRGDAGGGGGGGSGAAGPVDGVKEGKKGRRGKRKAKAKDEDEDGDGDE
ncbi:Transcription initiation factor TFIID subunit 13 [Agyrium rufum]|nr:Transcription initiation factor TFIID subunit 13 [Agyrium rufum]